MRPDGRERVRRDPRARRRACGDRTRRRPSCAGRRMRATASTSTRSPADAARARPRADAARRRSARQALAARAAVRPARHRGPALPRGTRARHGAGALRRRLHSSAGRLSLAVRRAATTSVSQARVAPGHRAGAAGRRQPGSAAVARRRNSSSSPSLARERQPGHRRRSRARPRRARARPRRGRSCGAVVDLQRAGQLEQPARARPAPSAKSGPRCTAPHERVRAHEPQPARARASTPSIFVRSGFCSTVACTTLAQPARNSSGPYARRAGARRRSSAARARASCSSSITRWASSAVSPGRDEEAVDAVGRSARAGRT